MYLGIDLGTTTIKICLINQQQKIIKEFTKLSKALIVNSEHLEYHEQNPIQIIQTVGNILTEFADDDFSNLISIGISGQMHGILFWNSDSLKDYDLKKWDLSKLITWMDQRCDKKFLKTLPIWKKNGIVENLATGYGLATMAWLIKENQLKPSWDKCGTIMDFLGCYLIENFEQSYISTHNANNWGYWTGNGNEWQYNAIEKIIPIKLLPKLVEPNYIIGSTKNYCFNRIPKNVKIFVGMGDLQASLLPILNEKEAVIHIGTSAQMVFIAKNEVLEKICSKNLPFLIMPYFDNDSLVVAASLNGGNAIEAFIRQIASWCHTLFDIPLESLNLNTNILTNVFNNSIGNSTETGLKISPLYYGERHDPETRVLIKNLKPETSVEQFLQEIAKGIIFNLSEIMPETILIENQIGKIRLINKSCQKIFEGEAQKYFAKISIQRDTKSSLSAAYGAAIFANKNK